MILNNLHKIIETGKKTNTTYIRCIAKKVSLITSKYRLLFSCVLTAILLTIIICNTKQFFLTGVPYGSLLYISCMAGAVVSGVLIAFRFIVPTKIGGCLKRIAIIILPIGTMCMTECLNGIYIGNWQPFSWVFNCVLYALLYLLVFAFSGSYKVPFLTIASLLYLISMANHYVLSFRGTPFLPSDLFYISTAATVAGTYEFALDYQVIISSILLLLITAVAWKITTPNRKLWKKIYYRVIAALLSITALSSYYTSDVLIDAGFKPVFFNQASGYQVFGVAMNFFMNTRYLTAEAPEGYDPNEIQNIIYSTLDGSGPTNENNKTENVPNIIVIMNETLSDLSALGEVKTNKDYMPFLRGLTKNTVKGNLYVPVIGAGTSNTEFEFLTGVSTAYLPAGSNAFTLYVDHDLSSLTKTCHTYGYSTTAFHPYFKNNWNRVNAYNYLGFEEYFALEDIFDTEIAELMEDKTNIDKLEQLIAERHPGEDVIKRWYVSDSYNYKKVIEMYEGKENDAPFFMFNVTMQNHSSYAYEYENFPQEIYLVDAAGEAITEYPMTNQYLSLVYESDKAFEALVNYFAEQDEPTIICMFGDHQPKIEDEFIAKMLGATSLYGLTVEQEMARYCTPFYIWANYDIEEREIDKLSVNYLSSYMMNIIGMEMPAFNQYLLSLSEILPVINTVGYVDAEGNYYTHDEESKYSVLLKNYEKVCYNHLLDEENCCEWLYSLKVDNT